MLLKKYSRGHQAKPSKTELRASQSFAQRFTTQKDQHKRKRPASRRGSNNDEEARTPQPFLFQSQFAMAPSQQRKRQEVHGKSLDFRSATPRQDIFLVEDEFEQVRDEEADHHQHLALARSLSHSSDAKHLETRSAALSRSGELRKSKSFHDEPRSKGGNNNKSIPKTAFDIHRLILESDERIKEMIHQAKQEDEEEEEEEQEAERLDMDEEEKEPSPGNTSSCKEFECNHCGNTNVVRVPRRSHTRVTIRDENNNNHSSSSSGPRSFLQRALSRRGGALSPDAAAATSAAESAASRRRRRFFRSKSKARFLNTQEQRKLTTFRRYLRQGSGVVGYHAFVERVEGMRARARAERKQEFDEDGVRRTRREMER